MSATAYSSGLLLEPMHPVVWGTLAPECECCRVGRAVAVCWFAPWFSFMACALCAEQIASAEIMSAALRIACK